jgi:hypothetical protein
VTKVSRRGAEVARYHTNTRILYPNYGFFDISYSTTTNSYLFCILIDTITQLKSTIMHTIIFLLAIFSLVHSLQATAAIRPLLPLASMHPITPPDLNWHMKVYTPPNEYTIYLSPGHTIEAHLKTIGKDLSPHILRRWEDAEIFEHGHYLIHLPGEFRETLELIRRDPGVDSVHEHAEYQAFNDPINEERERELGPKVATRHEEL